MARAGRKFSYYRKLTAGQKRIYDKSDALTEITLPQAKRFGPCVRDLKKYLASEDKAGVQRAAKDSS